MLLLALSNNKYYIAIASHYDKIDKNVKSHDALGLLPKMGKIHSAAIKILWAGLNVAICC